MRRRWRTPVRHNHTTRIDTAAMNPPKNWSPPKMAKADQGRSTILSQAPMTKATGVPTSPATTRRIDRLCN